MKQIQERHFDKDDSERAEYLERVDTSPHCGKAGARSQNGSCTGSFQNLENPKEIFADEDFTSLQKWGIKSRHGSHASFRYWMNKDDIILNLVPWYARSLWKCRHPIVSTQVSLG